MYHEILTDMSAPAQLQYSSDKQPEKTTIYAENQAWPFPLYEITHFPNLDMVNYLIALTTRFGKTNHLRTQ